MFVVALANVNIRYPRGLEEWKPRVLAILSFKS